MNRAGLGARLVTNTRRDHAYTGTPRGKTQPISFHRTMPGYAATPVVEMPELAATCKIARIVVKNEQERLGLPSFKLLGSSWALHQRVKAVADLSSDALIEFPDRKILWQERWSAKRARPAWFPGPAARP